MDTFPYPDQDQPSKLDSLTPMQFVLICKPKDMCSPQVFGPFDSVKAARLFQESTECNNRHSIVGLWNPNGS